MNKAKIKPTYFKDGKDSGIHLAIGKGVVLINGKGEITTKGLSDRDCGDLWFHVILLNEGKSKIGRYVTAGYTYGFSFYKRNPPEYHWSNHHYIIHESYQYYHFIANWNEQNFNCGKDATVVCLPSAVVAPMLGTGNIPKIKAAMKKYLQNI